MIPASVAFKNELYNDNRKYVVLVNMTLADGTTLTITNKDLVQGSFKIEDATSAANTFTVGGVVTGKLSFTLMNEGKYKDTFTGDGNTKAFSLTQRNAKILSVVINGEYSDVGYEYKRQQIVFDTAPESGMTIEVTYFYEDAFSDYEFSYATMTVQLGLELSDTHTIEYLMIGRYTVCEPTYGESTISLVCYDNMYKLSKTFNDASISYPATAYTLLQAVTLQTGVNVAASPDLPLLNSYQILSSPSSEMTCADVVACIAQINCRYAKVNRYGEMIFGWYDLTDAHNVKNGSDGGTFMYDGLTADGQPEANLDGGTFAYNDGDTADGGSFSDRNNVHIISSLASHTISTDDVVITGVSVTEEFDETEEVKKATSVSGTTDYLVKISGNPYIQHGQAATVAASVYSTLAGLTFRPFQISCLSDPTIEAGDSCVISDRKGNLQVGFISTRVFTIGNYETLQCDAEEPLRHSLKNISDIARAITTAKTEAEARIAELKEYEKRIHDLVEADRAAFSALVTNSLGGYSTRVQQQDGSHIYYYHDAATLTASRTVWRFSSDTFAWTNDYKGNDNDTTWTSGFDASGNAVLHNLSADWIKVGSLVANFLHGGEYLLGGINNANGTFRVRNEDNTADALTIDNKGIKIGDTSKAYIEINDSAITFYKYNSLLNKMMLVAKFSAENAFHYFEFAHYIGSSSRSFYQTYKYYNNGALGLDSDVMYAGIKKIGEQNLSFINGMLN